jgi:methylenetetrahydrofolate dehydrogenase (NADP+) / methenyltetrahydrofolate cyclohydrolase
MTAQILDGQKIAQQIKSEVAAEIAQLRNEGVQPGLAAILVGNNAASEVYVNNKVKACKTLGIYSEKYLLPADTTTTRLLELINTLNATPEIDGILLQLPVPPQIDLDKVINSINPCKDVDGFHPENFGKLALKQPGFVPCTPAGVMELLRRYEIDLTGKQAVVLGRSRIVGLPMALLLMHAQATVTICHSRTPDLAAFTRQADIIIAAMGQAGCLRAEQIKPGAIVVDVGINQVTDAATVKKFFAQDVARYANWESKGYILMGDVAPEVAQIARYLTPVPGGVGPLTIAMLMYNTVKAAKLRPPRRVSSMLDLL